MSCPLRIVGRDLDVDALIATSDLKPYRIWRLGDARAPSNPQSARYEDAGVCFEVSVAGFDAFDQQVADAIAFLERHAETIKRWVQFPGVASASLDFGIALRDVAVHCDYLPPKLLNAAARAGIGIELSHYP